MSEQIPPIGESATSWLCDRLDNLRMIRDDCDPSEEPCFGDAFLSDVIDGFIREVKTEPPPAWNEILESSRLLFPGQIRTVGAFYETSMHLVAKAIIEHAQRVLEIHRRFHPGDELGSLARLAMFQRLPDPETMRAIPLLRQEAAMMAENGFQHNTVLGPYVGKAVDGEIVLPIADGPVGVDRFRLDGKIYEIGDCGGAKILRHLFECDDWTGSLESLQKALSVKTLHCDKITDDFKYLRKKSGIPLKVSIKQNGEQIRLIPQ